MFYCVSLTDSFQPPNALIHSHLVSPNSKNLSKATLMVTQIHMVHMVYSRRSRRTVVEDDVG